MSARLSLHASRDQLASWANTPSVPVGTSPGIFPVLHGCPNTKKPLLSSMLPGLDEEGSRCWSVSAGDLPVQSDLWDSFKYRRCLIPVTSLLLDRVSQGGTRDLLRLVSTSGPIFSLAGVWNSFIGNNEREMQVFQVITVTPTLLLSPFFSQIPVVIDNRSREQWLQAPEHTLPIDLLRPMPAAEMKHWMMLAGGA